MAKFKIDITVVAACTYTVEMDYPNEDRANDEAVALWREQLPEDFQVDKGYITDWQIDTRQLTWNCVGCGAEIAEQQDREQDEMCAACFAKAEVEG
jgi:hypothetical protein